MPNVAFAPEPTPKPPASSAAGHSALTQESAKICMELRADLQFRDSKAADTLSKSTFDHCSRHTCRCQASGLRCSTKAGRSSRANCGLAAQPHTKAACWAAGACPKATCTGG